VGRRKKKNQFVAGFALETTDEIRNATAKMQKKNLDMIVLNSLRDEGAGFGTETNRITIIDRYNNCDKFELKSKEEAALDILQKIVTLLRKRKV
jgi:phosphopantothenoylcysteine decarboxylase/phosphopantothenate--cysteine ligase